MAELSVEISGKMDKLDKALSDSEKALKQFEKKAFSISKSLEKNAISTSKLSVLTEKLSTKYANGTISQAKYESLTKRIAIQNVNLSNKSKKLSADLLKVNRATKSLSASGSKLGSSSSLAAKGMKNLRGQTINGNAAMTAFSRTIQDAPFGIMGVSNNITNLTEQFGYLKNKTGSAKGALKAMLRDLKGFGGITLAISLITTALMLFGDKLFQTKDKAKELRDEQEKLTKSLSDYVDGLESVERASLKGAQNAQKELTTLNLLKSQIENTTLSTEKRLEAVKEMRRIYPSYLQDMSNEDILNGGLAKTYDTLTTSILNRAKATAATNIMVKNSEKLLALEDKLKAKTKEVASEQQKVNESINKFKQKRLAINPTIDFSTGVFKTELKNITNAYSDTLNKVKDEYDKLEGQIQKLESDNSNLEKKITEVGGIGGKGGTKGGLDTSILDNNIAKIKLYIAKIKNVLNDSVGEDRYLQMSTLFNKEQDLIEAKYQKDLALAKDNAVKIKIAELNKNTDLINLKTAFSSKLLDLAKKDVSNKLKSIKTQSEIEKVAELESLNKKYKSLGDLTKEQEAKFDKEKNAIKTKYNNSNLLKQNSFLETILKNESLNGELRLLLEKTIQENLAKITGEGYIKQLDQAKTFSEELNNLLDMSKLSSLSNFGSAIGNAIGTGQNVLQAAGASLLGSLGDIMVKYGKLILAFGLASEALKKAMENPFGGGIAAVVAGIALIAIGSAIKGAASSNLSSSGRSSGGGGGSVSNDTSTYSPSSSGFSGASSGGGFQNVVFQIQGTKLVGVLSNTLARNRALGGNLSIT